MTHVPHDRKFSPLADVLLIAAVVLLVAGIAVICRCRRGRSMNYEQWMKMYLAQLTFIEKTAKSLNWLVKFKVKQ